MKVLKAKVDWHLEYDNHPTLTVLVDSMPNYDTLVFNEINGIYYSIQDGYASYLYYVKPGEGFAGRTFTLKMVDGTTRTLIGPWSSRAGCVNTTLYEHDSSKGPIVDVTMTDDPDVYSGKVIKCFFAGAITMNLAIEAAKMARCHLVKTKEHGDITFHPSMDSKFIVKPRNRGKSKPTYKRFVYNNSLEYKTLREAKNASSTKILGACVKDQFGSIHSVGTYSNIGGSSNLLFYTDNGMLFTPKEAAVLAYAFGQIKEPKAELERKDISKW
jgi:hypothetical protein